MRERAGLGTLASCVGDSRQALTSTHLVDRLLTPVFLGFPVAQLIKNLPAMRETWVGFLGWEKSSGEWKGYPLQYSGLENSMECIVHGVAKSWTRLSDFHFSSHASKVMLKILQARLQQDVNQEFPDVQAGFGKGRGSRNQITNIFWIIEKESNVSIL